MSKPKPTRAEQVELAGTLDALQATGLAHRRKASWRHCPTCGLLVIHGTDANTLAETVDADPTPLAEADELACKLAGRGLYLLRSTTDRMELAYVDEWATPGTANRPVLPAHLCGAPRFPGTLQGATT